MENNSKSRNCNVDLLRILAATGVIILHLNSFSIGGILESAEFSSANSILAYFGESIFCCSVNVFLLISGYFLVDRSSIQLSKAIKLLLEISILSVSSYLIRLVIEKGTFSILEFILHILPLNYYIILYVAIFVFSPFINWFISELWNSKKYAVMLKMYIIVFMLYPFGVKLLESYLSIKLEGLSTIGILGDQGGYTVVNFLGMYLIGAMIKKSAFEIRKKYIIIGLLLSWFLLTVWKRYEDFNGLQSVSLNYNNPLIIGTAILSFMLFLDMDFKSNKIVEYIARASYMVYLLQGYCIHLFNAISYANRNVLVLLMRVFFIVLVIWLVSIPVNFFFEWGFSKLSKIFLIRKINTIGNVISMDK